MVRVVVVVHDHELLPAPHVCALGGAPPIDEHLPAKSASDAMWCEERSSWGTVRSFPDALLAVRHPRVDAPLGRRLRSCPRPPLISPCADRRRGFHSSERNANIWGGATKGHSLAAVFPGEPCMQVANSRVGDHQGMELLCDSCSPICKVDVQLPEVLLKEGDGDICRAEVGRVARAGILDNRQHPSR